MPSVFFFFFFFFFQGFHGSVGLPGPTGTPGEEVCERFIFVFPNTLNLYFAIV